MPNRIFPSAGALLAGSFLSAACLAGDWEARFEIENTFDEDGNRESLLEPTLRYLEDNWRTHLEWEKPVHPESEDGRLEWQFDYIWQLGRSDLMLRHELERDMDRERTRGQLTPRWYYNQSKSFRWGFDLEVDYYNSLAESEFDLFEVEIEPTVDWTFRREKDRFGIELEAPKYRLYSSDDESDDPAYVGLELIAGYSYRLSKATRLEAELGFPYDAEDGELETDLNFAIRHRF